MKVLQHILSNSDQIELATEQVKLNASQMKPHCLQNWEMLNSTRLTMALI